MRRLVDILLCVLVIITLVFVLAMIVPRPAHSEIEIAHMSAGVIDTTSTGMTDAQISEGEIGDAKWKPYSPMWELMSCCRQFWTDAGMTSGYCYTEDMKRWMENGSCNTFGYLKPKDAAP